jgi:UDP-N-acetylglucosamine 4,6-dehydratase
MFSEQSSVNFDDKSILVTGGTGSFGHAFVRTMLDNFSPDRLVIFSRDEWKQKKMKNEFPKETHPEMRYFIGDVRDRDRLYRAFDGIDVVVHAAALKQVPTAEYNPFEVVKTNVIGGQNIIDAAIDQDVQKVVALSTDKAANPINLYGATKLCADKLFVAGNHYAGQNHPTRFSVVRYGNVLGSRGSVIPLFVEKKDDGVLPITDFRMTRFWITLNQAVDLVVTALQKMVGGETFVPKIPSMKIVDLAEAIAPEAELKEVGIRPGEKIHEVMIPKNESRNCLDCGDYYVLQPTFQWWDSENYKEKEDAESVPEEFEYASNNNEEWMSVDELREKIRKETKHELDFST